MSDKILYNSLEIAETIKTITKQQSVSIKDMLSELGIGNNAMSHMRHGRMPSAESLAKIADYLGCSVDYLLGRTNGTQVQNAIELKPEEYPIIVKYRGITEQGRAAVDKLLEELHKNKNTPTAYSDERIETILQNSDEMRQLTDALSTMSRDKLIDVIRFVQFQKSLDNQASE